jgi:hypothetical protein
VFARSASVSTAALINRPMWNPTWINSGLLNNDSTTREYYRDGFSSRDIDEPSLGWYPPAVRVQRTEGSLGMSRGTQVVPDQMGQLQDWDSKQLGEVKMEHH